jgi:hypothetical protein
MRKAAKSSASVRKENQKNFIERQSSGYVQASLREDVIADAETVRNREKRWKEGVDVDAPENTAAQRSKRASIAKAKQAVEQTKKWNVGRGPSFIDSTPKPGSRPANGLLDLNMQGGGGGEDVEFEVNAAPRKATRSWFGNAFAKQDSSIAEHDDAEATL